MYSLALRSARRDPAACELVAAASIPPAIEGASRAGLQFRRSDPIFRLDPRKLLASASLNVTPIESDLAYLDDPSYPYLT